MCKPYFFAAHLFCLLHLYILCRIIASVRVRDCVISFFYLFATFACSCVIQFFVSLSEAETYLTLVFDWFLANRLAINANKTNFMLFSNSLMSSDSTLHIKNFCINKVKMCKFHLINIEKEITCKCHNNQLSCKLAEAIGMFKVASVYFPRGIMLSKYHSLFVLHLNYGILVWGNLLASYLHCIIIIHNRALRIIFVMPNTTHIVPLLYNNKLLSFDDLYVFTCCALMYKNCKFCITFCYFLSF